jgi:hypothetical protein
VKTSTAVGQIAEQSGDVAIPALGDAARPWTREMLGRGQEMLLQV